MLRTNRQTNRRTRKFYPRRPTYWVWVIKKIRHQNIQLWLLLALKARNWSCATCWVRDVTYCWLALIPYLAQVLSAVPNMVQLVRTASMVQSVAKTSPRQKLQFFSNEFCDVHIRRENEQDWLSQLCVYDGLWTVCHKFIFLLRNFLKFFIELTTHTILDLGLIILNSALSTTTVILFTECCLRTILTFS